MREAPDDEFDELGALDPLRSLLLVPRWRRVLGFAYFDDDPALVPGQSYEYRLTGCIPRRRSDGSRGRLSYDSVDDGAARPTSISVTCGIRLAQPATVARADATPAPRGPSRVVAWRCASRTERFWIDLDLETESAVIDFPSPVTAVVLELAGAHSLSFRGRTALGALCRHYSPVPAGATPRLTFRDVRVTSSG